jgi:hypothetical protein
LSLKLTLFAGRRMGAANTAQNRNVKLKEPGFSMAMDTDQG